MASAADLEGYIPLRIERLQRQKIWANWAGNLCFAIAAVLPFFGAKHFVDSAILASVAFFGLQAVRSLCDLHIDSLGALWRDLDRDSAEGLFDFETPLSSNAANTRSSSRAS